MDELVKALRETDFGYTCVLCEHEDMCKCNDCIIIQAADAIEELSNPRWIPVTERLPEPNKVDSRGFAVPYLVMNGWMRVTARFTENGWVLFGEGRVLDYVTHWMPLPQPPKEERA